MFETDYPHASSLTPAESLPYVTGPPRDDRRPPGRPARGSRRQAPARQRGGRVPARTGGVTAQPDAPAAGAQLRQHLLHDRRAHRGREAEREPHHPHVDELVEPVDALLHRSDDREPVDELVGRHHARAVRRRRSGRLPCVRAHAFVDRPIGVVSWPDTRPCIELKRAIDATPLRTRSRATTRSGVGQTVTMAPNVRPAGSRPAAAMACPAVAHRPRDASRLGADARTSDGRRDGHRCR